MSDEIARLVADVFELAGLLRRSGEVSLPERGTRRRDGSC